MVHMKKEKRKSGISVVGDVPWGTHLCQFYKTKEDLLDILIPYFKAGLENNEFCMWVASEPLNVDAAKTALGKVVKDLDDYINKGQFEILDYSEWYTKNGKFDSGRVLEGWVEKEKYALQNGFDGLRLTGNTFWLGKNDWDDFKSYEETVNDVIDKHRMIAICSYSLEKCNASEIIDVVSNHQFAIIRRESRWNVIESPEQKKTKEEFEESEENYRSLVENSGTGIATTDIKGRLSYVNEAICKITGYSKSELIGKPFIDLIHPDEKKKIMKLFLSAFLKPTRKLELEFRLIHKNGNIITCYTSPTIVGSEEKVRGFSAIIQDITERKKVEEMLNEKTILYETLVNISPEAITVTDLEGRITYLSLQTLKLLGYDSAEELLGHNAFEFIIPEDHEKAKTALQQTFVDSGIRNFECIAVRKDGTRIILEESTVIIRDSMGNPKSFMAIARDITERKKAEEEMQKSEFKFRTLVENIPKKVFIKDKNLVYIFCNKNYADDLKIKPEKIIGKTDFDFYYKKLAEKYRSDDKRIMETGKTEDIEEKYIGHGQERWVHTVKTPYKDEKNKTIGVLGIFRDITERKQAEDALKKSHQLLNDTGEMAKVGGWELDLSTNEVSWTEEVGRIHGVEPGYRPKLEEALKFYAPESRSAVEAVVKKAAETGEPYDLESLFIPRGSKDKIWVRSLGKPVYSGDKIVKLAGTFQNIDKYKRAEETLQKNLTLYRGLIETTDTGFVILDQDGKVLDANQEYVHLSGHEDLSQIRGRRVVEWTADYEKEKNAEAVGKCFREGQIRNLEIDYVNAQGKITPIEINATVVKVDGVPQILTLCRDITERKRAEVKIKASEQKLQSVLASSPDPIFSTDLNGNITDCNQATLDLIGVQSKEQLMGKPTLSMLVENQHGKIAEQMRKCIDGDMIKDAEYTFIARNNRKIGSLVSASVLKDASGKPTGFMAVVKDITERKKAEETLKHAEAQYKSLTENSPDLIARFDRQLRHLYVNPEAAKAGWYSAEEYIGKTIREVGLPDQEAQKWEDFIKTVFETGQVINVEDEFETPQGKNYFNTKFVPERAADGSILTVLSVARNITTRKVAEEKIKKQNVQLKKLDSVKTDFLNTTSHELRTPVASIKGYIQMLLKHTLGEISEEQKKALEVILRNTNRLDHLIQDILDISRLESGTMKLIPEKTDVTKIVKDVAETMQVSADLKRIKINIDIQKEIPDLMIDKERIKQVLTNLVDNAIKFSPDDSMIHINTRKEKEDVLFEVQDFGRGVPKNQQKKIFEKFYQVDSGIDRKYGGVGLGLAISKKIIDTYGGQIWVDSTVGKGSSFKFSLPLQSTKNIEDDLQEIYIESP